MFGREGGAARAQLYGIKRRKHVARYMCAVAIASARTATKTSSLCEGVTPLLVREILAGDRDMFSGITSSPQRERERARADKYELLGATLYERALGARSLNRGRVLSRYIYILLALFCRIDSSSCVARLSHRRDEST